MINQGWYVKTISRRLELKQSNLPQHGKGSLGGRELSNHRLDDYMVEI